MPDGASGEIDDGTECSQAAASSGATGFPCTSEFRFETVNYSDPTLSDPR